MNDYFKDISDWQDYEDPWRPTTHLEIDDVVELHGIKYRYHYTERDWWVLGKTKEENLAMGRCHVIQLEDGGLPLASGGKFIAIISGPSFEETMERMTVWHWHYLEIKDMTMQELKEYREQ